MKVFAGWFSLGKDTKAIWNLLFLFMAVENTEITDEC